MKKESLLATLARDRVLRPYLAIFLAMLAGAVAWCVYKVIHASDYLEVLQLFCTMVFHVHWVVGGLFYFHYYRTPRGVPYFLLGLCIAALLLLALAYTGVLALWFLFLFASFAIAVLLYRLAPDSPHFDARVRSFAEHKSAIDLLALSLLLLGLLLDVVNRTVTRLWFWRPFCILVTTVLVTGSHVWLLAFRLYDLDRYVPESRAAVPSKDRAP